MEGMSTSLDCCCSIAISCLTLCDPMDCSMPGSLALQHLLQFTQIHILHLVIDAIQPSHPLSSPSPAPNLAQHQGLFQWVSSPHQVAKLLELQLQYQSFQWIFTVDFFSDLLVWSPGRQSKGLSTVFSGITIWTRLERSLINTLCCE